MESRRGWRPVRNEEFQESEMWDLMPEREVKSIIPECIKASEPEQSPIRPLSRQLPSAAMLIPRAKKPSPEPKLVHHSAPVNIPGRSKDYGKSPMARSSVFTDDDDDDDDDDDSDDDEPEIGRLPPHEWLARKHRKKQISSFSVCEGAGRTLKGRDLRRVRHAVLTKTGFI